MKKPKSDSCILSGWLIKNKLNNGTHWTNGEVIKFAKYYSNMEEHQCHIRNLQHTAYCGKKIGSVEWAFTDPTHAIASIESGSRVQLCPNCKKKLIEILNKSE